MQLLVVTCEQQVPGVYVESVDEGLEVGMLRSKVMQCVVCLGPEITLLVRPSSCSAFVQFCFASGFTLASD